MLRQVGEKGGKKKKKKDKEGKKNSAVGCGELVAHTRGGNICDEWERIRMKRKIDATCEKTTEKPGMGLNDSLRPMKISLETWGKHRTVRSERRRSLGKDLGNGENSSG